MAFRLVGVCCGVDGIPRIRHITTKAPVKRVLVQDGVLAKRVLILGRASRLRLSFVVGVSVCFPTLICAEIGNSNHFTEERKMRLKQHFSFGSTLDMLSLYIGNESTWISSPLRSSTATSAFNIQSDQLVLIAIRCVRFAFSDAYSDRHYDQLPVILHFVSRSVGGMLNLCRLIPNVPQPIEEIIWQMADLDFKLFDILPRQPQKLI